MGVCYINPCRCFVLIEAFVTSGNMHVSNSCIVHYNATVYSKLFIVTVFILNFISMSNLTYFIYKYNYMAYQIELHWHCIYYVKTARSYIWRSLYRPIYTLIFVYTRQFMTRERLTFTDWVIYTMAIRGGTSASLTRSHKRTPIMKVDLHLMMRDADMHMLLTNAP